MSRDSEVEQDPTSYWMLVRSNADFRWLWGGQIVSLLGDWFNMIASVAVVASLTESGLAVGSLFVVRMLAPFLTSPLAGVCADRFSKRNILIASDLIRGFVVLGMLFIRDADWVWLLYVLTALQLGTSSFFFTARKAILPDIVDSKTLGTANALTAVTWSVMLAIGAALGGFTTGWFGVHAAFTIDAGTFFLSAFLVARIRDIPPALESDKTTAFGMLGQYWEGLRYLFSHPDLLFIALHKTALTLCFGTTLRVVQVAMAERIFPVGHQGGITMGLLFAAAGIGTGISPLTVRYFVGDSDVWLRRSITSGYFIGSLGLIVTAQLSNLETMVAGAFLVGLGNGVLWVFSSQLLLQRLEQKVRGRVFGTEFASFTLASAAGSAVVGFAIDSSLGIAGVLIVMAILALLIATAWGLWLLLRCDSTIREEDSSAGSSQVDFP